MQGILHNRTLTKKGKQAVLFNKYDGFACDRQVLNYVDTVVICYDHATYVAKTEDYLKHGIPWQSPGYEEQLVLPRSYFQKVAGR